MAEGSMIHHFNALMSSKHCLALICTRAKFRVHLVKELHNLKGIMPWQC